MSEIPIQEIRDYIRFAVPRIGVEHVARELDMPASEVLSLANRSEQ